MATTATMIPQYNTKLFKNIYTTSAEFLAGWQATEFYTLTSDLIDNDYVKLTYALLYAAYANNPIINYDENQFKAKLFATVFEYGPTWTKELKIQQKLRDLGETDLMEGATAIYNHAYNPNSAPSTEQLTYINEQNTTKNKKSKIQGYALLLELLKKDVTKAYVDQFKNLFKKFVRPAHPYLYLEEETEGEDDE